MATGEHRVRLLNEFAQRQPDVRIMEQPGARDLREIEVNFLPQHADRLEDISNVVIDTLGRTDARAAVLQAFRVNGQLLVMPMAVNVLVMGCNLELFERARMPLPSPEWDWQEFLETARALKSRLKSVSATIVPGH